VSAEKSRSTGKGRSTNRPAKAAAEPKAAEPQNAEDTKPKDVPKTAPVVEAGPVAVHVESGDVAVVVAPPGSAGIDRRLFRLINGLPHSTTSDRYVSVLSDLGEGLGWVAGGAALAILGGPKGRRAGLATAFASLAATYVVQVRVKPLFRRVRPFVNREARVVGIKPPDHSFPSGHTAVAFAAATVLTWLVPRRAPAFAPRRPRANPTACASSSARPARACAGWPAAPTTSSPRRRSAKRTPPAS